MADPKLRLSTGFTRYIDSPLSCRDRILTHLYFNWYHLAPVRSFACHLSTAKENVSFPSTVFSSPNFLSIPRAVSNFALRSRRREKKTDTEYHYSQRIFFPSNGKLSTLENRRCGNWWMSYWFVGWTRKALLALEEIIASMVLIVIDVRCVLFDYRCTQRLLYIIFAINNNSINRLD